MFAAVRLQDPIQMQGSGENDHIAMWDCLDSDRRFIWALARKFTGSNEEAEAAKKEIYADIWQYVRRTNVIMNADSQIVSLIARRRLLKYLITQ